LKGLTWSIAFSQHRSTKKKKKKKKKKKNFFYLANFFLDILFFKSFQSFLKFLGGVKFYFFVFDFFLLGV